MYISVSTSINLEIIGFWRLFSRDLECADVVGFLMESHLMDSQFFFRKFGKNAYFRGFVECPW
jgi:hypothetical protein